MRKYENVREHGRRLGAILFHEATQSQNISQKTEASFVFLTYHAPKMKSE